MICKYCGAEYDDNELNCPYCKSENREAAEKQKREILESYDREAQEMETSVPKKAVQRWTKYTTRGVLILLGVIAVILIISVIWGKIDSSIEEQSNQKYEQDLEEMYQAQEWEKMKEYILENYTYDSRFDKYKEVSDVWWNYSDYYEHIQYLEEIWELDDVYTPEEQEKHSLDWSEMVVTDVHYMLDIGLSATTDKALLGNEQIIQEFCDEVITNLREIGFTEEEIAEIRLGDESPQWEALVQKFNSNWTARVR